MNKTRKLFENFQQNLNDENINEAEETTEEDIHANGYCETFEGLNKEVEDAGGLYGFISNNYYKISQDLLREIALNAVYELDNDSAVLADLKERYYDYLSEDWEPTNLELDENGLPSLDSPYHMNWRGNEDNEGFYYITSAHPYNEAEYSYAKTKEPDYTKIWYVYNPEGKLAGTVEGYEKAVELMKDLDKDIKPIMSHN